MMKNHFTLGAGIVALSLTGCSGSSIQQSIEPPTTTTNPITLSTLQFAVGTANIAGVVGLNGVVTLRQNSGPNIGTSVLTNAPTITGPAAFKVPGLAAAPDAFDDAGTNHISGTLVTNLASPPPQSTFDPNSDGLGQGNYLASSLGFFPGVVANSGETPSLTPGPMPFYAANNAVLDGAPLYYIGGPPAYTPPGHTSTQDGTFPGGYSGYTMGIADFQAPPVSGAYGLNVVIPTGINSSGVSSYGTKSATESLTAGKILPAWTTPPTFAPDGTGGGTITTNFTGGGGATEEFIELLNVGVSDASGDQIGATCQLTGSAPYFYTFEVTPGTATIAVPDSIGAAPPGKTQPHTFCTAADNGATAGQDNWVVYGVAVDYPLLESGFPASAGAAAPTITSTGQDDLTSSAASGGPATTSSAVRRMMMKKLKLHVMRF